MAFGFVPGIISISGEVLITPGGYIREVVLPANTFSNTNLTNYPYYVYFGGVGLFLPVANGGKVLSSEGNDIMFYADLSLTTLLEWDLVYWDKVNGSLAVWIKIPTLSNTEKNTIYVNYGNPNLNLNAYYGNRSQLWSNDSVIAHFGSGSRQFINSKNDQQILHFGTGVTQSSLGELPYGITMGQSDINYLETGYHPTGSFSYSFHTKTVNKVVGTEVAGNYTNGSNTGTGISLFSDNNNSITMYADSKSVTYQSPDYLGTPVFTTVTYNDTTNEMILYKDGLSTTTITSASVNGVDQFLIGKFHNSLVNFQGVLSNFKIHNSVRTADDIVTEHQAIKNLYKQVSWFSEVPYSAENVRYISLTFPSTSTATDFPLYINLTFNDLKTTQYGGYVRNNNGYDIMFFADSAFTQPLQYEIESYSDTTGSVVAHVKIPQLANLASYTFYMTFGYQNVTQKPNLVYKTWNSDYKHVFNFANLHNNTVDTSNSVLNGTNIIPTTGSTTTVSGDDAGLYINDTSYDFNDKINTTGVTVYSWYKITDITQPYQTLFYVGNQLSDGFGLVINANDDQDGTLYFAANGTNYSSNFQISTGTTFQLITLILDNGTAYIYGNGNNLWGIFNSYTIDTPTNITTVGYGIINQVTHYFKGSINRLRFLDRIFTQDEIGDEWTAGNITRGAVYPSTGITAGYSFFFDPGNVNSYNSPNTDIHDLSVFESYGYLTTGVTYSASGGGSLLFDSLNYGYLLEDVTNAFNLSGSDGFAIESWVNIETFQTQPIPFSSGVYGSNYDWAIQFTSSSTIWIATAQTAVNYTISLDTPLLTDTWYHVLLTGNNASETKLYINGILVHTYTQPFVLSNQLIPYIEIGGYGWSPMGGNPLTYGKYVGKLGICRTYQRQLTANNVLQNYNFDAVRYGY